MSRVGVLSLARTQHLQINVLFTPKNIRNLGIPPKNIIATPKKKNPILYLDLQKILKMYRCYNIFGGTHTPNSPVL